MRFKKLFSNLEPEGQGQGIIMEVTRLLLLGLFYTIQTKRDQTLCTRVYVGTVTIYLNLSYMVLNYQDKTFKFAMSTLSTLKILFFEFSRFN